MTIAEVVQEMNKTLKAESLLIFTADEWKSVLKSGGSGK
jgi:hypothetical protein